MASALRIDFDSGLHYVTSSGNTLTPNKPWQWPVCASTINSKRLAQLSALVMRRSAAK